MRVLDSDLIARFNPIPDRILDENFLHGRGLGNEISFYVFDYPPECELEMRAQLEVIQRSLESRRPGFKVLVIDLFDVVVQYLQKRNVWQKAIDMQRQKGNDAVRKPLDAVMQAEKVTKFLIENPELENCDVVFLTGVGNVFPLLRSHSILNNLHAVMSDKPVVLFFPGEYDGQSLRLFGLFTGEHYYRAFRLVP